MSKRKKRRNAVACCQEKGRRGWRGNRSSWTRVSRHPRVPSPAAPASASTPSPPPPPPHPSLLRRGRRRGGREGRTLGSPPPSTSFPSPPTPQGDQINGGLRPTFRSIALWAIPYHPCSSSGPSTAANTRATALGSFYKCECACVGVHMCMCKFVHICVCKFVQIFASRICSRIHVHLHRCVYVCMLPATLLNVMGHSPPLQLWGLSFAQIGPSTSESSA